MIVVEVLSPSTARTDRVLKVAEYRRNLRIKHYLLLEQDWAEGVLHTRDGETWRNVTVAAPDAVMFSAVDVTVPMAEVYGRVVTP